MGNRRTLKERLSRMHVFTVLVCALAVIAFARIDVFGVCYGHYIEGEKRPLLFATVFAVVAAGIADRLADQH